MCSFDGADLWTNSDVLVSFPVRCQNVCGTFVERLWNIVERLLVYCFDIPLAYPEAGPEDGYEAEAVLLLHTSHSLTAPQRTTVLWSQSNGWYRRTIELVQHFRCRGSSHRRKSAAWHNKIDVVWLYRSPIPVGMRGYFTCPKDFYLPLLRLEEGGGVSTL
jgi:hypothetical protein